MGVRILQLFALACVVCACSHSPKTRLVQAAPSPPSVPGVCLVPPMPEWELVDGREGGKDGCPAEFAACITDNGSAILERNVGRWKRAWSEVADRCGALK